MELVEETLNAAHQIILVAAELDDATERIIKYLNERDIAINVIFFQVFQNGCRIDFSAAPGSSIPAKRRPMQRLQLQNTKGEK